MLADWRGGYLTTGIHEDDYTGSDESFWLITMTPRRHAIAHQRQKIGRLVAARVSCREIFEATLLAGAGAIACTRTHPARRIRAAGTR